MILQGKTTKNNPAGTIILIVPGNWKREITIEYDHSDSNSLYRDYGLNIRKLLLDIFVNVESIDLFQYNNSYHMPLGLIPLHDLAFLCHKD